MQAISAARVSILIGLIYDCVAEPTLWSNAIRSICEDLHCMLGSILVWDLMNSNHRSIAGWNHEPFTTESISKYGEQVTAIYRSSETPFSLLLDEPLVISRDVPFAYHEDLPLYRDLVKPLGLCDSVQTIVLRDTKNKRLGVFAANRHVSAGLIEDRQVEILRLLAPHIRRAVTIGDLLNLNAALNESLASSLNMLRTALVLVSGSGRILHANDAAERMFRVGIHIRSRNGTLAAASSAANNELMHAIKLAHQNEAAIGGYGIGVPLPTDGAPAIAHVLPLKGSNVRAGLVPHAAAAVFVAQSEYSEPSSLDAFARLFGLTPAESRLLYQIASGATLTEAAISLGVSEATVRTHMQRILRKTGVSRQATLLQLIASLMPGVGQPDNS